MPSALEVYALLPKTNCKICGETTCMAFATALLIGKRKLEECKPLFEEDKYAKSLEKLKEMIEPIAGAKETGFVIHPEKCSGCGNCVVACPVNVAEDRQVASGKGPSEGGKVIIRVKNGVVVDVDIKRCRRFGPERILCTACVDTCAYKAIEFVGI